jgi:ABC-type uncharacterized transport system ATPase subunit
MSEPYIRLKNICKSFGTVQANKNVSIDVSKGEILALLGENGSGKSTLVNMLSGIYTPDSGEIEIGGKNVVFRSPKDAINAGIGMIHQHFKLIDVLTAAENIVIGQENSVVLSKKKMNARINELSQKYGISIDPDKKVYNMSVSEKQSVEIMKILYRGADVLILDEPTAVLTPQETDKLFAIMRNMKADGKSLIIITHKLHEVLDVSDRVAVLRKGEYVGDVATKDADQQSLTDMMVGHTVSLNISRPEPKDVEKRLVIEGLTAYDELGVKRLDDVSFTINAGEVLGIAGVAGSGQRELLESIAGLYPVASGHVTFYPPDGGKEKELVGLDPMKIRKSGISMSFVPEDRLGMGLVGSMGMTGNMMLRSWRKGKGLFLNRKDPEALANRIWEELGVVTPSTSFPVRRMSGGNVQKVLVGREIAQSPAVLMTAYAVRGLDINTSYTIYNLLTEQKMKGVAVVYVGEDLDVLLELCDRIVVLCGGQVSGVVDARKTDKREVGALMTLVRGGNKDE